MSEKAGNDVKLIMRAAKSGDAAAVSSLLAQNATLLDARDADESTALHFAAWKGHVEVAQVLLDAGADVNARNNNRHYGNTPLHAAAHANNRAVAELLIDRGADITAEFGPGRTPLRETGVHDARAVAKLLRDRGATH